jgi:hypothetical protein
LLLAAELIIRPLEPHLSRDLAQIRAMPKVADQLRAHSGRKVLVVGNSLSRCAIDIALLTSGLKAAGRSDPAVFVFTPDGTSIVNWDYGVRRYFLNAGAKPDEIILGVGRSHLHDSGDDASRLAAYYVDGRDVSRAWAQDLPTWEQRCEFMLSRASVLHASRYRIKPHVFGTLVPDYFDVTQWMNSQSLAHQGKPMAAPKLTYHHLEALLAACKDAGIQVTVVSMPLPEPYVLPDDEIAAIKTSGARWLPLQDIGGLQHSNFPDGYHLNEAGACVLTQALVDALKKP